MSYNQNLPRGTNPSFTAGANGANPLIPIEVQRDIMSVALEQSIVLQMANKQDMGTQLVDMPVMAVKPTAYFVNGDSGLKQTTYAAWKNIRLTAEEIAVLVTIPQNVVNDTNIKLWDKIKPEVGEAIGRALDAAVLFGTSKPASWPAALGPQSITAGNTVTHGAGVDVAADINNVIAAVESDGFQPSGIAMRQTLRASLRGLRSTTNQPIYQGIDQGVAESTFGNSAAARKGTLFGLSAMTTLSGIFEDEDVASANAVELLAVDWSQIVIGVRQDITMDFSNSAIITDDQGAIQYNAWQQDGVVGRFVARFGYAVPNPITRLNSTESTRWPASVLRMAA
jgi:HK97 family phage major capsid protein